MMKNSISLIAIGAVGGIIFFAWYHELLIVRFKLPPPVSIPHTTEQSVTLWYAHNHTWHHEQQMLIFNQEQDSFAYQLIKQWLAMMLQHGLVSNNVDLESVAITGSGSDMFISFDRPLFHKQQSTYQKVMIVEALGKTLCENGIKAQRMHLLVHHSYMHDQHLLCNYGLPLSGFSVDSI